MNEMNKELALIKGAEVYKWGIYNGRSLTLSSKRGTVFRLTKGEKFGARYSADGKKVRVVFAQLGLTHVFTLDADILKRIYKNATPLDNAKAVKPGKEGAGGGKPSAKDFVDKLNQELPDYAIAHISSISEKLVVRISEDHTFLSLGFSPSDEDPEWTFSAALKVDIQSNDGEFPTVIAYLEKKALSEIKTQIDMYKRLLGKAQKITKFVNDKRRKAGLL